MKILFVYLVVCAGVTQHEQAVVSNSSGSSFAFVPNDIVAVIVVIVVIVALAISLPPDSYNIACELM